MHPLINFVLALILVATLAFLDAGGRAASSHLSASATGVLRSPSVKRISREMPSKDVEAETTIEPTGFSLTPKPEELQDLSFTVSIVGENAEFYLSNRGATPQKFFDSLAPGWSGLPRHTWIQVLTDEGELYKDWPVSMNDEGDWTPNYLSNTLSDIATCVPADLTEIGPGETRSLVLPLDEFFARSRFVGNGQGYRVRVVSELYLDADLTRRFVSRSDWAPLKLKSDTNF